MDRLILEGRPKVVGTLSSLDGHSRAGCDVVEVRLDKTSRPPDWLARCEAIEVAGVPVLLTARLRLEGGDWEKDDEARRRIYQDALGALSAVDVELRSAFCAEVAGEARRLDKVCIASYHDFQGTPSLDTLSAVVNQAHALGAAAKVSTLLRDETDLGILRSLLAKKWGGPLCVIGMGEAWRDTRLLFPILGSCLTYGYLDQPTAPGQWPAAELSKRLRALPLGSP